MRSPRCAGALCCVERLNKTPGYLLELGALSRAGEGSLVAAGSLSFPWCSMTLFGLMSRMRPSDSNESASSESEELGASASPYNEDFQQDLLLPRSSSTESGSEVGIFLDLWPCLAFTHEEKAYFEQASRT